MNRTSKNLLMRHALLAVAALTLPCASVLAETMDVVHTRGVDANADGRSGGNTYVDNRDQAMDAQQSQAGAAAHDPSRRAAALWACRRLHRCRGIRSAATRRNGAALCACQRRCSEDR